MNKLKKNILYIGLNGYAGSGKDTLAKALRIMLEYDFPDYESFIKYYNNNVGYDTKNDFKYATYDRNGVLNNTNGKVMCIAFADQLKHICASLFGVSTDRFYYNKANAYICMNHNFEYTEQQPDKDHIITADEFYYAHDHYTSLPEKYYMSLREVLVYVGTYIIQDHINKRSFINIVNNSVSQVQRQNEDIKYVICTDVRFMSEVEYIKDEKHGIMINIVRDDIKQLDNVAEHDLDDMQEYFDYTIDNNGTYEEMFKQMWDIIHQNIIFQNITLTLRSRDDSENYLRKISDTGWELVSEYELQSIHRENHNIKMIDPIGGPMLVEGKHLDVYEDDNLDISRICWDKGKVIAYL